MARSRLPSSVRTLHLLARTVVVAPHREFPVILAVGTSFKPPFFGGVRIFFMSSALSPAILLQLLLSQLLLKVVNNVNVVVAPSRPLNALSWRVIDPQRWDGFDGHERYPPQMLFRQIASDLHQRDAMLKPCLAGAPRRCAPRSIFVRSTTVPARCCWRCDMPIQS
jgi:hypothetical protein